jgi:hypothetical protein
LRAGWSSGDVQNRYCHSTEGGDQVVGRCVTGLPINDSRFSSIAPHFHASIVATINWFILIPAYEQLPNCFKQVLPFLLASLAHHYTWLQNNLNKEHPIFTSLVFVSGELDRLKQYVHVCNGVCDECNLSASGIPPHLVIANELIQTKKLLLEEIIKNRCDIKALPEELTSTLRSKFDINGAIAVTIHDMQSMFNTFIQETKNNQISTTTTTTSSSLSAVIVHTYASFTWKERIHMVPEGFKLPSSNNIKDIWNLWYFGRPDLNYAPYRNLIWTDLINNAQVTQLSKIKKVINTIGDMSKTTQYIEKNININNLPRDQSNALFDHVFPLFIDCIYPLSTQTNKRWGEVSIATAYSLFANIKNKKKRKAHVLDNNL